jgi:m7GpppX diphosphatase
MSVLANFIKNINNLTLISADPEKKVSSFWGFIGSKETIVLLKPLPIDSDLVSIIKKSEGEIVTFKNERFSKYELTIPYKCEITTLSPAIESELSKFRDRTGNLKVYNETPEEYQRYVKPFIQTNVKWIESIFNEIDDVKKTKTERVLYHDDIFALQPDIKWDNKDMTSVYCLAIVRDRNLHSIRDLNGEHIAILKHILNKSLEVISTVYEVPIDQIRSYFHYHPTYWWLHIHFNVITYRGAGICVDDAIPLVTTINNLEICSDYYQKATLTIVRAPIKSEL